MKVITILVIAFIILTIGGVIGVAVLIGSCVEKVMSDPEKLGESVGGIVDKFNKGYEKATTDKTD